MTAIDATASASPSDETVVRLTTSMAGANFSFEAGAYLACDADTAGRLIDSQQAEAVDPDHVHPDDLHRFPVSPRREPANKPEPQPTPNVNASPADPRSLPIQSLELDTKIADTLAEGLAELPEADRPHTVGALVAYDEATGLEELAGVGRVSAGKIRAAITARLSVTPS